MALTTASLLVLSACTSVSTWTPPAPPTADAAVEAALPTGAYVVAGELRVKDSTSVRLDGFVDFGTAADGIECQSEYSLTTLQPNMPIRSVESRRALGGPTFYRDTTDPATPGEWFDTADPAAPLIPLLFIPAIVAADYSAGVLPGAGTGNLCSIPVMARFMTIDGETLSFDAQRTKETAAARTGLSVAQFLAAVGVEGAEYDETAELLFELSAPDYTPLTTDTTVTIDTDATGKVTLTQFKNGKAILSLMLTPTNPRVVDSPGAPTYFEKLATEVKAKGVDAVLEGYLG